MTLSIKIWPDPILNKVCSAVPENEIGGTKTMELSSEMLRLMYEKQGIGLAAPQVGVLLRMFVVDVWWPNTGTRRGRVFINPVLTDITDEEFVRTREGCLSLPGVSDYVSRKRSVRVDAMDEFGTPFTLYADGLQGVCIQHEYDHLEGITLAEKFDRNARRLLKKQFSKKGT